MGIDCSRGAALCRQQRDPEACRVSGAEKGSQIRGWGPPNSHCNDLGGKDEFKASKFYLLSEMAQ